MKRAWLSVFFALLALCLGGCGGQASAVGGGGPSITLLGSTSMEQVMGALAEQFRLDHADISISVEGGGSSAGVEAAANGSAHIGLSSRALKESERDMGLTETLLALDGVAVIVNASNPVDSLTLEELASLYEGSVDDWGQVGGTPGPVAPIGREAGSGTREGFESVIGVSRPALAQELVSTGAVVTAVRANPQAVGYASLPSVEGQEGIKTVAVDGVACTEETVLDGSYPIQRPFMLLTGTERTLSGPALEFFDWVRSEDAASTIRAAGAVPVCGAR